MRQMNKREKEAFIRILVAEMRKDDMFFRMISGYAIGVAPELGEDKGMVAKYAGSVGG